MIRFAALSPLFASADALLVGVRPSAMPRVLPVMQADEPKHFYTVTHTFTGKEAAEEWWAAMGEMDLAEMAVKQHETGIIGHSFMPSSADGPIFCLWECKE